ncbi:hypothetical protein [Salinithrix halophila]|uniref:Uncharacterized protein n=1 Tax=Salinithrix halophila TaxID=1485204 RepID=A0ABV8J9H5_9BACL
MSMTEKTPQKSKPIDLIIDETKYQLLQVMEKSGLRLGILELLTKDILTEIQRQKKMTIEQYFRDQDERELTSAEIDHKQTETREGG